MHLILRLYTTFIVFEYLYMYVCMFNVCVCEHCVLRNHNSSKNINKFHKNDYFIV